MRKLSVFLAVLGVMSAILAGILRFSLASPPSGIFAPLHRFALANQGEITLTLVVVTVLLPVVEGIRTYLTDRHQTKSVLDRVISGYSREWFNDTTRDNRLTLFKVSSGWRLMSWALVRAPFAPKSWGALLFRLRPMEKYLGVYIRPRNVRNHLSAAVFRISDRPEECEGVAGLTYDKNGLCSIEELPAINAEMVSSVSKLDGLSHDDPVRIYAARTNVKSVGMLRERKQFSRFFAGTVVRDSNDCTWGVLLLDSADQDCPVIVNGKFDTNYLTRFTDCARIVGRIIT